MNLAPSLMSPGSSAQNMRFGIKSRPLSPLLYFFNVMPDLHTIFANYEKNDDNNTNTINNNVNTINDNVNTLNTATTTTTTTTSKTITLAPTPITAMNLQ